MKKVEARALNQLLKGQEVYVSKYQGQYGSAHNDRFFGFLDSVGPYYDGRVIIQVKMYDGNRRAIYLPPEWTIDIALRKE